MSLQKLLDGFKLGRETSDASRQCQLAAWRDDRFDDWALEDEGADMSPFSLGEPRSSEGGLWTSYDNSAGSQALHTPVHSSTSGALSTTVQVRHDRDR